MRFRRAVVAVIDLGAELLAALRSSDGRAAIAEAVRPVLAAELRRALDERERDRLIGLADLAALLGSPSVGAAKMAVRRDPELAALALRVGSRRRWQRSAVLALLDARRAERAGGNRSPRPAAHRHLLTVGGRDARHE